MLLGDLIARFNDEAVAEETIIAIGDLALLAAVRQRAEEYGDSLGAYMASAAQRYAAEASGDEWVTLLGIMGQAQDPGAVYLQRALAHASRPADRGACGHVGHA